MSDSNIGSSRLPTPGFRNAAASSTEFTPRPANSLCSAGDMPSGQGKAGSVSFRRVYFSIFNVKKN